MYIWVYIFVAILAALIITAISLNVRIIICYENGKLEYYAKILKIKIKIDLKKWSKGNSNKVSFIEELYNVRHTLLNTLGKFVKKVHFKIVKLKVVIAGENATQTALLYGAVTPVISAILEFFDTISTVNISKNADLLLTTDYLSQKSSFEGKIVIRLNILRYLRWRSILSSSNDTKNSTKN